LPSVKQELTPKGDKNYYGLIYSDILQGVKASTKIGLKLLAH
jgi:hypothetical protein